MLDGLFIYSLKSSAVLVVIYLAYYFLFRNNTRFQLKRVVLVSIMIFALTMPALEFRVGSTSLPEQPAIQQISLIQSSGFSTFEPQASTPVSTTTAKKADSVQPINWLALITKGYGIGLILMAILLAAELVRIAGFVLSGKRRNDLSGRVITHRKIKFPFSFLWWTFVPERQAFDECTWQMIEAHEQVHIRQYHSTELIVSSVLRSFLWFNPVAHLVHRDIKNNHEALADSQVLRNTDLATYTQSLLSVCLQSHSMSLVHNFALKAGLSKRINIMKMSKTNLLKSLMASLLFVIISAAILSQTSIYGQESQPKKSHVTALEMLKSGSLTFTLKASKKLSSKHTRVFEKLQSMHDDKELSFSYLETNDILEYLEQYKPYQETLYFDKLSREDKTEIWTHFMNVDKSEHNVSINGQWYNLMDYTENFKESIDEKLNYLVIYHRKSNYWDHDGDPVYEMYEVDELPDPVGGLNNFTKSVALDMKLPEGIDLADLPETVDFEFVVHGGGTLSHINLLTELKGNSKKTKDIYRFFGDIHNNIRGKTGSVYKWRRGVKDGQPVKVRMKVSIPTKYM